MKEKVDSILRILWLSDIHFQEAYKSNQPLIFYIDSFLEKSREFTEIDYLVISGDIAQEGQEDEYNLFDKIVMSKLLENLPKGIKLLVVPGNHDLKRDNVSFEDPFLESMLSKEKLELYEKKSKFLQGSYDKFVGLFDKYTGYLQTKANIIPSGKNATLKDHDYLFGHVLDENKKSLFILLNTAWYSVGHNFLERYIDDNLPLFKKLNDGKEETRQKLFKTITRIADEYGKQLSAVEIDHLKEEMTKLAQLIDDYKDYVVITIMHHPLNWLEWRERVHHGDTNLHKIKENTDLILTGHEHVPRSHYPELIHEGQLLHIPAGSFIDATQAGIFDFSQNWFSILEINVNKRTINQLKYFFDQEMYDGDKKIGDPTVSPQYWTVKDRKIEKLKSSKRRLEKKYNTILTPLRRTKILERIKNRFHEGKILEKLLGKRLSSYPGADKISYQKNHLYIYHDSYLHQEDYSYLTDIIKDFFSSVADPLDNHRLVLFIGIDLNFSKKIYATDDKDRLIELGILKDKIDFNFDKFRRHFFTSLDEKEACYYQNLPIVNDVRPYWAVENLLLE
jgi:UDP-2,3-diacylglucosamine pyrophosphatase LpxH